LKGKLRKEVRGVGLKRGLGKKEKRASHGTSFIRLIEKESGKTERGGRGREEGKDGLIVLKN